jgi:hypothetical protein
MAEHLAELREEIRMAELLANSADGTLQVNVRNYISLHQYARELILLLDEVASIRKLAEQRIKALESDLAIRTYRRPVGRPRKISLGSLVQKGLLGSFAETEKPAPRKGGRPPIYPDDFLFELNAAVVETWDKNHGDNARFNLKTALREVLTDYAESRGTDPTKVNRRIEATIAVWYSPLSKYRIKQGLRLRSKSQNRLKKAANFEPLLEIFARWHPSPHSGTHNAATKGKHGRQTGKARARKR